MSDIDSDDDFIKCYECEIEVDVSEICIYKKDKICKNCYEECRKLDVAQPVRMVYKVCEDNISYSCCGRENCVRIKCCGTVKGHIHLYGCDPEIVNYPLGLAGIFSKTNMHRCPGEVYLHGQSVHTFMSNPFEETNLLRQLRLQKTERLNLIKEKEQNEKMKVKIKIEKDAKEIALRYKSLQEEKQKDRYESLTIGTKIVELEAELCYKLHGVLPYIYNPGARLSLYEDNRFKTLDSVILQAHEAYRTKNFEAKDHMEKILVILEKWLEEIDPNKYREIKGLPRMPPPHPFNWNRDNLINRFNMTSK
jgi:hypothetical protein